MSCNHKTCNKIKQFRSNNNYRGQGGVAVLLLNNYYNRGNLVALLGKEKGGKYKDMYNLCSGGVDSSDNHCYIKAARRELLEEFKINVDYKLFDTVFRNSKGKIRYLMHYGTPVFIGIVSGVSRSKINPIISLHNSNNSLPYCLRELYGVDYFWLNNKNQIEGYPKRISSFANSVMSKINVNNL